jgi:hypothetical protein
VILPYASQGTARQREAGALAYGSGMAPQPMPVWVYFGRAALPYGTLPTRLIYAQCKLCITLSEVDKTTRGDDTRKELPRDPPIRLKGLQEARAQPRERSSIAVNDKYRASRRRVKPFAVLTN